MITSRGGSSHTSGIESNKNDDVTENDITNDDVTEDSIRESMIRSESSRFDCEFFFVLLLKYKKNRLLI